MLKQGLIYLGLSILVVLLAKYAQTALIYMDIFYAYVNVKLIPLFNFMGLGFMARRVVLLVLLPVLIIALPAFSYRVIKGKTMPYLLQVTWCLWLTLVMGTVLIRY